MRAGLAALLPAIVAAGCFAACSPLTAHAQAQPLPWPQNPDWQRYVEAPPGATVAPIRVVSTSGDVSNPAGILAGGSGNTTLTMSPGGTAPVIELDYGNEISGFASFVVSATAGTPVLRDTYAEQLADLSTTGDCPCVFLGSASALRYEDRPISGPGTYGDSVLQGGQRYQMLTLTQPGSVTLSSDATSFGGVDGTAATLRGHFISSDDLLNRIWYAGIYTMNLTQVPPNTTPYPGVTSGSQHLLIDGAKRDRGVWSGDITIAGKTLLQALDPAYLRDTLCLYAEHPSATPTAFTPADAPPQVVNCTALPSTGAPPVAEVLPGECLPFATAANCVAYSGSYSLAYVPELYDYYLYTGDLAFVTQMWPAVVSDLTWAAQQVDSNGLLLEPAGGSFNWNIEETTGEQAWDNALYYQALTGASALATAQGLTTQAATYDGAAQALRVAFNARLWDAQLQAYSDQPGDSYLVQDGNVTAVAAGLADPSRASAVMSTVTQQLASPYGALSVVPANASLRSQLVSPFMSGWQVLADFSVRHTQDALNLIRTEWGYMLGHDPGGVFWEKIHPDGTLASGDSAAHGWGTGATAALSQYVLGAQPASAGFHTFAVTPQPGDLSWAEGSVPTPTGGLDVAWGASGETTDPSGFAIEVSSPSQITGTVAVPLYGAARAITEDGQLVWDGVKPAAGVSATTDGQYVYFANVTGQHLWEWGTIAPPAGVPETPWVPALPLAVIGAATALRGVRRKVRRPRRAAGCACAP